MVMRKISLTILFVFALLLAGCANQPEAEEPAANNNSANQVQNTPADNESEVNDNAQDGEPVEDAQPEPTAERISPLAPDFEPLPPERQPVEVPTADGRDLEGIYFPAKVPDAPVVVLMHWAGGTMNDWTAIAPWLQNRKDELAALPAGKAAASVLQQTGLPYLDPNWFPSMPEEVSFAVLVFNFGDFGNSPYGGSRESWVDDAYDAMAFAAGLDDVDPHRVSALGASIGADGAVDACYLMNRKSKVGSCVGALSLSPGNYLTETFTYNEAATGIDLDGFPVWCLAAENDYESPTLCRGLSGLHSQSFIFLGGDHGMELIASDLVPYDPDNGMNVMELIQSWLEEVYGVTLMD